MIGNVSSDGSRIGGAADDPQPTSLSLPNVESADEDGLVVGVIDTGLLKVDDGPHEFLVGHLTDDWPNHLEDLTSVTSPDAHANHGTFVCGLILKEAPRAMIAMRNVLGTAPDGLGSDHAVAEAIRSLAAIDNLQIINMSFFGAPGQERDAPLEIKQALRELFADRRDVLVVIAAGNSAANTRTWPACLNQDFEQVIAVGAVDDSIKPIPGSWPPKASFSNFGTWIDAYAAGVRVLGPTVDNGQSGRSLWSGTSFAAATVTGRLARAMADSPGVIGLRVRENVLRGPAWTSVPGLREEDSRPYVRSRHSTWPEPAAPSSHPIAT